MSRPEYFGGEVQLWTTKKKGMGEVPLTHSDAIGRGVGLADLAFCRQTNKPLAPAQRRTGAAHRRGHGGVPCLGADGTQDMP